MVDRWVRTVTLWFCVGLRCCLWTRPVSYTFITLNFNIITSSKAQGAQYLLSLKFSDTKHKLTLVASTILGLLVHWDLHLDLQVWTIALHGINESLPRWNHAFLCVLRTLDKKHVFELALEGCCFAQHVRVLPNSRKGHFRGRSQPQSVHILP